MARSLKLDSFIGLAVAAAFFGFFTFTKHDPALSVLIPFANDPYDAISTFGMVVSGLLAVLSLFRVFRPYRSGSPSATQEVFIARTHMAIAMAVLVPLASDAIALARHLSVWTGAAATGELVALVAGMGVLAGGFALLVGHAARGMDVPVVRNAGRRSSAICLTCAVVLALYPEGVIGSLVGELFSLGTGIVLFSAALSALTTALLPYDTAGAWSGAVSSGPLARRWVRWGAVTLLGIAVGVAALMGEAGGGSGGIAPARLLMVAGVFIGAGTGGIVAVYFSLRTPLGLFRSET